MKESREGLGPRLQLRMRTIYLWVLCAVTLVVPTCVKNSNGNPYIWDTKPLLVLAAIQWRECHTFRPDSEPRSTHTHTHCIHAALSLGGTAEVAISVLAVVVLVLVVGQWR